MMEIDVCAQWRSHARQSWKRSKHKMEHQKWALRPEVIAYAKRPGVAPPAHNEQYWTWKEQQANSSFNL